MSKHSQPSLVEAKRLAFAEQQQAILCRMQIKALPSHETRTLPLACIQVPDEALVQVPGSLVQSIGRFGVLQAPSVVCCSWPEEAQEHTQYEVIAGRRRTKGARLAGLTELKCEVYTSTTPQLSALLALIENAQRSSAWIKEVADLRLLIGQRVGMTVPELIACGFTRAGLEQRLKIAQLPAPLLDQIVAGKVPLDVTRKLVRLTESQLSCVVEQAQNVPLTGELVKQALNVQINADLSPMQIILPTWEMPVTSSSASNPWALGALDTEEAEDAEQADANNRPLADLLMALRVFLHSDASQQVEDAQMLIQALIQRLEVAMREPSLPQLASECS